MRLLPIPMHLKEDRYVTLCKTWRHVIRKTFNDLKQDDKCQWILWNVVPLKQTLSDVPEMHFLHSTNFLFPRQFPCAKGPGIYQRNVSDIMLGHEASGNKKHIRWRRRKNSNAFPRTSLERQPLYHSKSAALASGNLYYSFYQRKRRGQLSSLHRKSDFQIMTFESSREGMTYS